MTHYYTPGDRITTADGEGFVMSDYRLDPEPINRIWVMLDAGDNPQNYRAEEVTPCAS